MCSCRATLSGTLNTTITGNLILQPGNTADPKLVRYLRLVFGLGGMPGWQRESAL